MSDLSNLPAAIHPDQLLSDGEAPTCPVTLDVDGQIRECRLAVHRDPKMHVMMMNNVAHAWQTAL